jgi:molybdopterin synthase sulfur carrier subunit
VTVVRIPPVLRAQVGGEKQVDVAGDSLSEILAALTSTHPGLRSQLFTDDGQLNRFVNVYVDGQDVRYLDGLGTTVGEADVVMILPAMAGGD